MFGRIGACWHPLTRCHLAEQRHQVDQQSEGPFEHPVPYGVLAVGDRDGFDERGDGRRSGPQADDQPDRDRTCLIVQDGVDAVAIRLSATSSLKMALRNVVAWPRMAFIVSGRRTTW